MHERGRKETTIKNYKYTTSHVRRRYMLWKKEKKENVVRGFQVKRAGVVMRCTVNATVQTM